MCIPNVCTAAIRSQQSSTGITPRAHQKIETLGEPLAKAQSGNSLTFRPPYKLRGAVTHAAANAQCGWPASGGIKKAHGVTPVRFFLISGGIRGYIRV